MAYRFIFLYIVGIIVSVVSVSAQYTGQWVLSHDGPTDEYRSGTNQSTLLESADAAHAAVMGANGSEFFLRTTSDSGKTWRTVLKEDEENGWVVWRAIAYPTTNALYFLRDSSYQAFDPTQGIWRKFYRTHLYRSTDGGTTWSRSEVAVSGSKRSYAHSYTFAMADSLYGVVARYVSGENKTVLLVTEDGGKSWQERDVPDGLVIVWRVYCPERGVCVLQDWRGRVERSDDDGKSWERLELPKELSFIEMSFFDSRHVWIAGGVNLVRGNNDEAIGERDVIYRSEDGGRSWQVSLDTMAVTSAGLTDIAFADELNGIAVGRLEKIYRTRDGGATWQRENSPYALLHTAYNEISYPSVGCAIALTTKQFIVRYTGKEILQRPKSIRPFGIVYVPAPLFEWSAVAGADSYHLQIAEGHRANSWDITYFGENTVVDTVVSGLSWQAPLDVFRVDDSVFYYYRVQAQRGVERSDWSEARSFSMEDKGPIPLGVPLIVRPDYGATVMQPVQLSWRSVGEAERYEVHVANTISFEEQDTAEIVGRFTVSDTTVSVPMLKSGYWYFWRVRAISGNRFSGWSSNENDIGVFKTTVATAVEEVAAGTDSSVLDVIREEQGVRVVIGGSTSGELRLYSSGGREMVSLRRRVESGSREFVLGVEDLPSGVYYLVYRSDTGGQVDVQALPLLR